MDPSMEQLTVQHLIDLYDSLIRLYGEMEGHSRRVHEIVSSGSRVSEMAAPLAENARIAESIKTGSAEIVRTKEAVAARRSLTGRERRLVRAREQDLSKAVERVIELENSTRDIMGTRGMKISRR